MTRFLILISIILPSLLFGQNSPNEVIISGRIIGEQICSKQISVKQINLLQGGINTYRIQSSDDGTFCSTIKCYHKQEIKINYGGVFKAIISPGDSLFIEFKPIKTKRNEIKTEAIFKGDKQNINRQLNLYLLDYYSKVLSKGELKKAYQSKSPRGITIFARKIKKRILEQQQLFKEQVQAEKDIEDWLNAQLKFGHYNILLNYASKHRGLNKLSRYDWSVPSSFYRFFKDMPDVCEKDYVNTDLIYQLSRGVLLYITDCNFNDFGLSGIPANFGNPDHLFINEIIGITEKHPKLKQLVLGKQMHSRLSKYAILLYEEVGSLLKNHISDKLILAGLEEHYHVLKKSQEKPTDDASVQLLKLNSHSYDDMIKEISKENPTKIVFIDFWASWCAPCIAAMKKAPVYHKSYENKDISFVYICTNSKEPDWKMVISKNRLQGSHYYLNAEQSSLLNSAIHIRSLPRYLIINNGKVYKQQGTLSSPSNPDTRKLLDQLIE